MPLTRSWRNSGPVHGILVRKSELLKWEHYLLEVFAWDYEEKKC
jgi:hypothetical protein